MHTFLGIHFKMMFASDGGLICFVNITQRISQAWGWQVWECSTDHSALDHGECWTDEAGAKLVAIYESDLQRVQTSFTPSKFLYETYACQGFLLVIANNQELDAYYREDLIWLNDLSTKTWDLLPTSPEKVTIERNNSVLCELRRDAVLGSSR